MRRDHQPRQANGQQTAEFAAAMVVLICVVFVPLIDLGIIPIRFGLGQGLVGNFVRKLSLQEKISQAFRLVDDPEQISGPLAKIGGITAKGASLSLAVTNTQNGRTITISKAGGIPPSWLPEGSNCPCNYTLQLAVESEVSPLVVVPVAGKKIPGLNAPFRTTFAASAPWENLGRDPLTKEFYINE